MKSIINIIIAGASGFIGEALIKRLIKEDVCIWAIGRTFRSDIFYNSDKIKVIQSNDDVFSLLSGRIDCQEHCQDNKQNYGNQQIPQTYDLFYNFAWQGVNGPDKADYNVQINNIKLALNYAELAHSLGCKKYLCAGTIAERAVDSLPFLKTTTGGMLYGSTKLCTRILLDTYCKRIGLNFVWMQFANIYGPRNKTGNLVSYTIDQLSKGEEAIFGPALQPYDFLYVDDLIEAVYRLGIEKTSKNFYYIGTGQSRILKEYLLEIGKIMGRQELIKIGKRPDDGIIYTEDMFDINNTVKDIGIYCKTNFTEGVKLIFDEINDTKHAKHARNYT